MKRNEFLKKAGLAALILPTALTSLKAEKPSASWSMYDNGYDPSQDTGYNWPMPYDNIVKCDGYSDNTLVFDNWLKGRSIYFDSDKHVHDFESKTDVAHIRKGLLFNDVGGNNKFFYAFFRRDSKHLHISYQRKNGGSPIIYMHNLDKPENNAHTLNVEFNCYLKSVLATENKL